MTTSRPFVTEALLIEIWTLFLHNICTLVQQTYNIPDELIINVDQTLSKYMPTSSVTTAEKNSKHVHLKLAKTLSGDMLPLQMIYIGKTSCSLPAAKFPESFLLGFKKLHWSNEEETLPLLKEVISPYITNVKKK